MAGNSPFNALSTWAPNYEVVPKEEDPFASLPKLPSLDHFSDDYGCYSYDLGNETVSFDQEYDRFDAINPYVGILPDPLYRSLDIDTSSMVTQGDVVFNGAGFWNELSPLFEDRHDKQPALLCNGDGGTKEVSVKKERNTGFKRRRSWEEDKMNTSKLLTKETISQYFYMPITQAAKQMNIGLTLLKKRCRELGIRRWPHRKLMSLQTLIKNVQEMEVEGDGSGGKLKNAIKELEREKKTIEEAPDRQMEDNTKKLRQACFKANYKKRKLMGLPMAMELPATSSSSYDHRLAIFDACTSAIRDEYVEEDEELRSLLSDSSCSNIMG